MDAADESLVENFARLRTPGAFKALVQRYQLQLYNVAYRMIGNHEDAEEMVQETFLRVYTCFNRLRKNSSFYAWLLTITINLCRDLLRVKQRRRSMQLLSLDQDRNGMAVAEAPDRNADPSLKLEKLEQSTLLEKLLVDLPTHQRAVLVLRDVERLPYQQIAAITGTNLGTVRSRLHYARLKLRVMLEPYYCGGPLVRGVAACPAVRPILVPVSNRRQV